MNGFKRDDDSTDEGNMKEGEEPDKADDVTRRLEILEARVEALERRALLSAEAVSQDQWHERNDGPLLHAVLRALHGAATGMLPAGDPSKREHPYVGEHEPEPPRPKALRWELNGESKWVRPAEGAQGPNAALVLQSKAFGWRWNAIPRVGGIVPWTEGGYARTPEEAKAAADAALHAAGFVVEGGGE